MSSIPAFADATTEARMHFSKGSAHYAVGEFAEAAEEYQAAYKLKPESALLYNAAQAYRFAGNYEKALVLYRNYVLFYPNAPNLAEVNSQIAKMKDAIAAKTSPPTGTVEPGAKVTPSQPEVKPVPPASNTKDSTLVVGVRASAPSKTPVYKKWWLWTIVGVVVAGAVVGGVVGATHTGPQWSNIADLGPGVK